MLGFQLEGQLSIRTFTDKISLQVNEGVDNTHSYYVSAAAFSIGEKVKLSGIDLSSQNLLNTQ